MWTPEAVNKKIINALKKTSHPLFVNSLVCTSSPTSFMKTTDKLDYRAALQIMSSIGVLRKRLTLCESGETY